MIGLLLIARIAGRRVALPAADVEAVVELDGVTPVPGTAAHVAGLAALRSRVLTVIDCSVALGRADASSSAGAGKEQEAVVVPSGGHTYALLVDEVEDVVEAVGESAPLVAPTGPGWDRVATAMVQAGDDLLLLVDPHLLVAGSVQAEAL